MSLWIELRCSMEHTDCFSAQNAGPKRMTLHRRDRFREALNELSQEARNQGWKRSQGEWKCPACIAASKEGAKP